MNAHGDITFACISMLLYALDLLDPAVTSHDRLKRVGSGLYRLLPYALEYWSEHLLLYGSLRGSVVEDERLTWQISEFCSKHDRLLRVVDGNETGLTGPNLQDSLEIQEPRLETISQLPAYRLVKQIIHLRRSASQEDCADEKGRLIQIAYSRCFCSILIPGVVPDIESYALKNDRTLLSKLAVEFENSVLYLLSQEAVIGLSTETLNNFKSSYSSTAFRCRYPSCPSKTLGFPSAQLRKQHESIHLQRIYCNMPTCQWSRIGFRSKNALDTHKRNHHTLASNSWVPPRVRGPRENSNHEYDTKTKQDSSQDNEFPVFTYKKYTRGEYRDAEPHISKLFLNKSSPMYVTEGQDWFAYFEPRSGRKLDVDLVHSLDHESVVSCAGFSPKGDYFATGSNALVNVYNVGTGDLFASLPHGDSFEGDMYVRSLGFLPEVSGKPYELLVTGTYFYATNTHQRLKESLSGHLQASACTETTHWHLTNFRCASANCTNVFQVPMISLFG
jgi:hypothetical protein